MTCILCSTGTLGSLKTNVDCCGFQETLYILREKTSVTTPGNGLYMSKSVTYTIGAVQDEHKSSTIFATRWHEYCPGLTIYPNCDHVVIGPSTCLISAPLAECKLYKNRAFFLIPLFWLHVSKQKIFPSELQYQFLFVYIFKVMPLKPTSFLDPFSMQYIQAIFFKCVLFISFFWNISIEINSQ